MLLSVANFDEALKVPQVGAGGACAAARLYAASVLRCAVAMPMLHVPPTPALLSLPPALPVCSAPPAAGPLCRCWDWTTGQPTC